MCSRFWAGFRVGLVTNVTFAGWARALGLVGGMGEGAGALISIGCAFGKDPSTPSAAVLVVAFWGLFPLAYVYQVCILCMGHIGFI